MEPGAALRHAAAERTTETMSMAEAVAEFGTRRVAEMIGVSQRQVQRYVTGATQKRKPPAVRIERLQSRKTLERWKKRGVKVKNLRGEIKVSNDVRTRTISDVNISAVMMSEPVDLLLDNQEEAAGDAFGFAFGNAYGVPLLEILDVEAIDVVSG